MSAAKKGLLSPSSITLDQQTAAECKTQHLEWLRFLLCLHLVPSIMPTWKSHNCSFSTCWLWFQCKRRRTKSMHTCARYLRAKKKLNWSFNATWWEFNLKMWSRGDKRIRLWSASQDLIQLFGHTLPVSSLWKHAAFIAASSDENGGV